MHFSVFLGLVVAMDTKGCRGWSLSHSPPLMSQLARQTCSLFLIKVKQIPAPKFCLYPSQTLEAPLWKARLVLRQLAHWWGQAFVELRDHEHKNINMTRLMAMTLEMNQGRFTGIYALILRIVFGITPPPKSRIFCSPLSPRNHLVWSSHLTEGAT